MAINKTETGWLVDIQPGGRGAKRFRKSFKTKSEAMAWETWLKSQLQKNRAWEPERKDLRRLSELVDLWYSHHGSGLASGQDTLNRLKAMAAAMGDPVADFFTVNMFANYRTERLKAGITANNMNREHAYLRAMFNELTRLGYWKKQNPLANLRPFRIQEAELTYLTSEKITRLLKELCGSRNPHVELITRVCLATGARWSEVEEMRETQVHDGFIQFARTKSAKTRAVPITESLVSELRRHNDTYGVMGRVFPASCMPAFRVALDRTKIALPDGQMTHVLRHTFASHFMMNGGNILTLQRILGHSTVTMTMRYAHLSPDHLQEAKLLNPLVGLSA
ncbi:MAG: phage integrase [Paenalcaligenes sp.]